MFVEAIRFGSYSISFFAHNKKALSLSHGLNGAFLCEVCIFFLCLRRFPPSVVFLVSTTKITCTIGSHAKEKSCGGAWFKKVKWMKSILCNP